MSNDSLARSVVLPFLGGWLIAVLPAIVPTLAVTVLDVLLITLGIFLALGLVFTVLVQRQQRRSRQIPPSGGAIGGPLSASRVAFAVAVPGVFVASYRPGELLFPIWVIDLVGADVDVTYSPGTGAGRPSC